MQIIKLFNSSSVRRSTSARANTKKARVRANPGNKRKVYRLNKNYYANYNYYNDGYWYRDDFRYFD